MRTVSRWKALSMLLAGFLAGVAFVIACGTRRGGGGDDDDGGRDAGFVAGRDAAAQENGACSEWEVLTVPGPYMPETEEEVWGSPVLRAPEGWEPLGFETGPGWWFRRCVR